METFKDPTGTIVRMTFAHPHKAWEIGQHFYLTFPALNIWQSHPFTPASNPTSSSPIQSHTYIIRACNGETAKLAALSESAANCYPRREASTPVIMMGVSVSVRIACKTYTDFVYLHLAIRQRYHE
jgi:hypothetical protein